MQVAVSKLELSKDSQKTLNWRRRTMIVGAVYAVNKDKPWGEERDAETDLWDEESGQSR